MAEVTWFKVLTDIFADDKIKIIQSMPEGDSLLVMWFKVLSQAGKTNDGGYIYLRKNIPYTPAMLATLFNKPQMIVEIALKTFTQFEMIDIDDNGYIFVTHWEKHQSIDALEKIKEKDRIRQANYRERKRLELKGCHVTVTLPSHTNHAIELEVDVEKENKYTTNDFELIRVRFRELHGLIDLPIYDSPIVTKLLTDGIPVATIISTMEKRFKKSASTIKYYEAAIREAHQGVVAVRQIKKYDPELESRKEEIARNKWIDEGNDPNGFVYKPASGD